MTLLDNKELHNINDLVTMQWSDIEITGLKVNTDSLKTPKPEMAI